MFLGPYLTELASAAADADGLVRPFGISIRAIAGPEERDAVSSRGWAVGSAGGSCVELELVQGTIISAVLLAQLVAVVGAAGMGLLAGRFGAKRVVLAGLVLWTGVLAAAYVLPAGDPVGFALLAALIGLVLGGTQALSRSLFSQMVPAGREAEYFSLYEISDRGTSWLGALLFGLALDGTGSYRVAILSLLVFFVLGGALLAATDLRRAIREAGGTAPARL